MIQALFLVLMQIDTPSLSREEPVQLYDEGVRVGRVSRLNCSGAGVSCSRSGTTGTISVTGGGGGGYDTVQDDGSPLTSRTTINFTGAGVSCSDSGGITVCTISGGGAGSGNFVEVDVDFSTGRDLVTTTVTGQAWVTGTSKIMCAPTMLATASRGEGAEDAVVEGLTVAVHSRVVGTGFSVTAAPAQGLAYGVFKFHCVGG